ncbi:DNA repair protein RecO [uncultured Anaerofustis sp.]|uniref:DNA repair protein RecO n=1 Tax=uncultured Anaerofustis sp. TaxID=904996 RepID=UPI0025E6CD05|nr:DNA repair protein RecO [uncultured Anaerofustis sp.]
MIREFHGIVLKNIKFSENDRILTVFTKERGKISVMAKNAASKKSKVIAQTSTFSYSYFCLYPGKNFYTLKSADYIKSFPGLQTDLERLSFASYISELVDIFYEDKMEEPITFNLIIYILDLLQKEKLEKLSFITLAFMLKLLGISGIIPDFSGCSICSATNGEYYILDFDSGSILCGKCTMKHFSMNKITLSQLNLINKLTYVNVNDIKNMSFDEFTLEECNNMIVILNNYITYTLHRKTNSFKFLSDMLELK